MKKINLRDYYPFYSKDTVVEVPEEVALLLREFELLEEANRIRTYRYRAFYSLDYTGEIERDLAALDQKSPYDILEESYDTEQLYKGLASLPEKQRNRIYAHYFLGMSKSAIARAEKINESNVRQSIEHGLRNLEKFLRKSLRDGKNHFCEPYFLCRLTGTCLRCLAGVYGFCTPLPRWTYTPVHPLRAKLKSIKK